MPVEGSYTRRTLAQLESDSLNTFLALHNLPFTDAHLIYDAGRTDLRKFMGLMMTTYQGVLEMRTEPPHSALTDQERQTLQSWCGAPSPGKPWHCGRV